MYFSEWVEKYLNKALAVYENEHGVWYVPVEFQKQDDFAFQFSLPLCSVSVNELGARQLINWATLID